MHAHWLQHVPFEGLGSIEPRLENGGYEITGSQFFKTADLPDAKTIDLLVIMGGPTSVKSDGFQSMRWIPMITQFSIFRRLQPFFIGTARHSICRRERYGLRRVKGVKIKPFNSASR